MYIHIFTYLFIHNFASPQPLTYTIGSEAKIILFLFENTQSNTEPVTLQLLKIFNYFTLTWKMSSCKLYRYWLWTFKYISQPQYTKKTMSFIVWVQVKLDYLAVS